MTVRTIKHPLSGAVYDLTERGTIEVTKGSQVGEFTAHGVWMAGELRQADPHLCLWIGGKQLPNRFRQAAEALTATSRAPQSAPTDSPSPVTRGSN